MMYLLSPTWLYAKLLSSAIFRMPDEKVYLTFDDGPDPDVTPHVLKILDEEKVPATFFLLGKNAEKHPTLMEQIRVSGHTVANHGYEHLNAWKLGGPTVLEDAEKCAAIVDSKLYRPPYGRLYPSQLSALESNGFQVFLWTGLSGDFDDSLGPNQVVRNVVDYVKPGSLILMHDSFKSSKAKSNLLTSLPLIIQELKAKGFSFGKL